jgi:hypothetical protein
MEASMGIHVPWTLRAIPGLCSEAIQQCMCQRQDPRDLAYPGRHYGDCGVGFVLDHGKDLCEVKKQWGGVWVWSGVSAGKNVIPGSRRASQRERFNVGSMLNKSVFINVGTIVKLLGFFNTRWRIWTWSEKYLSSEFRNDLTKWPFGVFLGPSHHRNIRQSGVWVPTV